MISFKDYYETVITEANVLPWKEVPEEDRQKAWDMIEQHNKAITNQDDYQKKGFYIIDVTGKHQVYYTFWRYREIDPRIARYIKNPIYFGNLTTNLLTSVEKALSKPVVRNVRVELLTDETRSGMIGKTTQTPSFTFGKYRGKTFPEVYLEDPSYFAFLSKNADPRYQTSKTNLAIQAFASMYFDDVTKKNQETSTSQYVGNVGDNYQGELELYNVKSVPPQDAYSSGYTVFKLKDGQGNKFMTYKFPTDEVGSTVKIKGKVRGHKEILGIKFTKLGYIKAL